MANLKIRSGMHHFRLIRRVVDVTPGRISGETQLDQVPVYLGLEAMSQLAALHVRQRLKFKRHAFLLNVKDCRMPASDMVTGRFIVTADLRSHSTAAFHYDTAASGPQGQTFRGRLLIGTREYDGRFSEDILKAHYEGLFAELRA